MGITGGQLGPRCQAHRNLAQWSVQVPIEWKVTSAHSAVNCCRAMERVPPTDRLYFGVFCTIMKTLERNPLQIIW